MNSMIITNSKNPLMCIGMSIIPCILRIVSIVIIRNNIIATNMNAQGFVYALLSFFGSTNNLMNSIVAIITRTKLYIGAISVRDNSIAISHTPLILLFVVLVLLSRILV